MLEFAFVAIGLLFAVVLIVALQAGARTVQARNSALEEWGRLYGFTMVDPVDPNAGWFSTRRQVEPSKWADLKALKGLHSGSAQNFQEGVVEGFRVRVFDTWYVISTGKSTMTVYHGVVALELGRTVPGFALRKHNLWDSIAKLFGTRDIEIGSEDFDRAFHISGDEPFLKQFLDQEAISAIRKSAVDALASTGTTLVLVRCKQCAVDEFDDMLEAGLFLARQITAK